MSTTANAGAKAIRLLIVDDHPVVRAGLRSMLAEQPDFVVAGEAGNGREAIAQAKRLLPDVILMDLRMPEVGGVEAICRIREQVPGARILILTTYGSDEDILGAIEAGATGYLLKDTPRQELYRAIRAAAAGEPPFAPSVAARLLERVRRPRDETLTPRELEVLTLVAQGASNREIAASIYVTEATVKSHLLHIFGKLGVTDRTAAVTSAIERGILHL
ncbi:MAG TPA: response regulator transcription factor [Thermomicrobiaceae bacterium]|nr:response regulator transcription factor [Thermomicrobiaceae bacterium]